MLWKPAFFGRLYLVLVLPMKSHPTLIRVSGGFFLVLVRIDFVFSSHGDPERPQHMENTNRIRMGRQNVWQTLVAMQLVQLAQSSRVYTQSHLDYVIEDIGVVFAERKMIRGL
jgi:hypothetical protein